MAGISLGAAAEQTRAFMRRESGLVLPLAFATFGLGTILIALVSPAPDPGGQVMPGFWSLALFPMLFLGLIGQLSISYLVLRPGVTVRDSLRSAVGRVPTALAAVLILLVAVGAIGLVLGIASAVLAALVGANATAAASWIVIALMLVLLFVGARLLLAWPLIVDRDLGARGALKQAFALSRGHALKFAGLTLAFALVYAALTGAVQLGLGSILLILGRLTGLESAATFLAAILVALLGAAVQGVWAVLLACVYRQLAVARGGASAQPGSRD